MNIGALYLLSILGAIYFPPPQSRVWDDYYTLLAPAGTLTEESDNRLSRLGRVISKRTATVEVTIFNGMERVAIADLEARFDPLDPRYDRYVRSVGDYFHADGEDGALEVVYIASRLGWFRLWVMLHRLSLTSIRMADRQPLVALLFAALVAVLPLWLLRRSIARSIAVALAGVISMAPIILFIGQEGVRLPVPQEIPEATDFSWEALDLDWRGKEASSLPGMSEFIAHQAYQQSLAYGRAYRLPMPDEVVTIARFDWHDDRLTSRDEALLTFDDQWLEEQVAVGASGSDIETLLIAQDRPVRAILQSLAWRGN